MNNRNIYIPFFILSLTFLVSQNSIAAKIYHWTDEEGNVHFSDIPPDGTNTLEISEVDIDGFDDNSIDPERYSIINQVDRMAERRRQITEERLAKKRIQLEEKRLALELEQSRLNEILHAQEYQPRSYVYAYPQLYSPYYRKYQNNDGYQFNRHGHRFNYKPQFRRHLEKSNSHRVRVSIGL